MRDSGRSVLHEAPGADFGEGLTNMTGLAIEERRASALWKELWVQVLIAMALGILLGISRPELATAMQPLGDAFIKVIRMLIAPIIFCTVVHGIAHMADMARVGRVALKAMIYFEVMTTVALIIGLAAQPGRQCSGNGRRRQMGECARCGAAQADA
jgi:Na+/H+-dicarboxylate symporter